MTSIIRLFAIKFSSDANRSLGMHSCLRGCGRNLVGMEGHLGIIRKSGNIQESEIWNLEIT